MKQKLFLRGVLMLALCSLQTLSTGITIYVSKNSPAYIFHQSLFYLYCLEQNTLAF